MCARCRDVHRCSQSRAHRCAHRWAQVHLYAGDSAHTCIQSGLGCAPSVARDHMMFDMDLAPIYSHRADTYVHTHTQSVHSARTPQTGTLQGFKGTEVTGIARARARVCVCVHMCVCICVCVCVCVCVYQKNGDLTSLRTVVYHLLDTL